MRSYQWHGCLAIEDIQSDAHAWRVRKQTPRLTVTPTQSGVEYLSRWSWTKRIASVRSARKHLARRLKPAGESTACICSRISAVYSPRPARQMIARRSPDGRHRGEPDAAIAADQRHTEVERRGGDDAVGHIGDVGPRYRCIVCAMLRSRAMWVNAASGRSRRARRSSRQDRASRPFSIK